MSRTLIIGTRNPHKRIELQEIFANFEVGDLTQFPDLPEVIEDGLTFEANARKKATEVARQVRQWVLAEDSGLVVPALGGRPGIYSARFAGTHGDHAANNARLLAEMANFAPENRQAYYICVAAVSDPNGTIQAMGEGRCHGLILTSAQGMSGFGYDPLFLIPEYHQTFGELTPRVKNAISHRARAMESLQSTLQRILRTP